MTDPLIARLMRASAAARLGAEAVVSQAAKSGGGMAQPKLGALLSGVLGRLLPRQPELADPPADGSFTAGSYAGPAGSRPYRLFLPASARAAPPLLVMLHGCTQSPEDFAAGTRMNVLAARAGVLVLYPAQVAAANAQRCWNWFDPAHRARDSGEAALLAGMTRQAMAAHGVDPRLVFVAGLSAGGAQAAVLGAAHPELFAAVGVHSGLASGAASDMGSAFSAMRQGRPGQGTTRARTIIFQGDRDTTVNPRNADFVADQVQGGSAAETLDGRASGGLAYTRSVRRDAAGRAVLERWTVHGLGHAWSGGSAEGSYAEPAGPDASAAMLEFFLK